MQEECECVMAKNFRIAGQEEILVDQQSA